MEQRVVGTSPRLPVPSLPHEPDGHGPGAVRICRDCRHLRPDYVFVANTLGLGRGGWRDAVRHAGCGHWSAVRGRAADRAVTGAPPPRPDTHLCSTMRGAADPERCGPQGRFWEPRPADVPPPGWRDPALRRRLARDTGKSALVVLVASLVNGTLLLLLVQALP